MKILASFLQGTKSSQAAPRSERKSPAVLSSKAAGASPTWRAVLGSTQSLVLAVEGEGYPP